MPISKFDNLPKWPDTHMNQTSVSKPIFSHFIMKLIFLIPKIVSGPIVKCIIKKIIAKSKQDHASRQTMSKSRKRDDSSFRILEFK